VLEEDAQNKYDSHAHCLCTRMHRHSCQGVFADNASVPTRSSNAKPDPPYLASCPTNDSLTHTLQYTLLKIQLFCGYVCRWASSFEGSSCITKRRTNAQRHTDLNLPRHRRPGTPKLRSLNVVLNSGYRQRFKAVLKI
jgi:hypothetical protein